MRREIGMSRRSEGPPRWFDNPFGRLRTGLTMSGINPFALSLSKGGGIKTGLVKGWGI
jgi:hypothetical protein